MDAEKIQAKIDQLLYYIEGYRRTYPEGHIHHNQAQKIIYNFERIVRRLRERLKMVDSGE
jgi:hypothetical protein